MLLSDVSADWVEDALDGYAGKAGHWIVLAIVMLGYAIYAISGRRTPTSTPRISPLPRRSRLSRTLNPHAPIRRRFSRQRTCRARNKFLHRRPGLN